MSPLLTLSYWTALLPPPTVNPVLLSTTLILFGTMVAAGIVLYVLAEKLKARLFWAKGAPKLASLFLWMGLLGLMHIWLAHEQVYIWGARFWLPVGFLAFLVWLVFVLKYIFVNIPELDAVHAEKARIGKYLPKRK